jgi:chromosome segregation protein
VQFKRLRLSGFKSFVDPTELVIEKGLTGIVGPNGCGKSNLLEAMRWVMGETSSKSLRGAGMEDVIFAGSGGRPQRNFAEVALLLDNGDRTAPAQFNESDELEISRRIEREMGSAYQVNARDVRQRDVQLLFADSATGAHSPALVSQGKIGNIINAKPTERRAILEEAAGISGLHSRRKEAESKLKAAETNLERIDDVVQNLDAQIAQLKRQARQAERYRELSNDIRQTEAVVLFQRWQDAARILADAEAQLKVTDAQVSEVTQASARISTKQAELAAGLPDLRQKEAEAAAALQRLRLAVDELSAEATRVAERKTQLERQIADIVRDKDRESLLEHDATAAIERLTQEEADITSRIEGLQGQLEAAAAKVAEAEALASDGEQIFDQLTQRNAEALARKRALDQQKEAADLRISRLTTDLQRLDEERLRLQAEAQSSQLNTAITTAQAAQANLVALNDKIAVVEKNRTEAEAKREKIRGEAERARESVRAAVEQEREAARLAADRLREAVRNRVETAKDQARVALDALRVSAQTEMQETTALVTGLRAESTALERVLIRSSDAVDAPAVLDSITVQSGFEAALGAALSEDLSAPVGGASKRRWADRADVQASDAALPAGVRRLSDVVTAPAALARRLAQIGLIDAADGARLVMQLQVGQRLVSADGQLWRWDGFFAAAPENASASERLANRNRLVVVQRDLAAAETVAASVEARTSAALSAATLALETATQNAALEMAAVQNQAQADGDAVLQAAQAKLQAAVEQAQAQIEAASVQAREAEQQEQALRQERRTLESGVEAARRALAAAQQDESRRDTRLQGLADTITRISEEKQARENELGQVVELLTALPDFGRMTVEIGDQRRVVDNRRNALASARVELDALQRSSSADKQRIIAISADRDAWSARLEGGRKQAGELTRRLDDSREELADMEAKPAQLEAERVRLTDQVNKAEAYRSDAADVLVEAETALRAADSEARQLNEQLLDARETRARLDATVENQSTRRSDAAAAVVEQFQVPPIQVLSVVGIEDDSSLTPLAELEPKLERLKLDRERLGAVNLLAEQELREQSETSERIQTDRNELIEAIAKLRGAIGSLNREGRQRLLAAFEEVNGHFKTLFSTLFGGGEAHLALLNADGEDESKDPLEAGLEIMAAPPGKKITHMTLMSGGEQALTATALIFAVFLTNPAPICVLDEVDAPLDDANVERYCDLLDDMIKRTNTRFLIVTHNAVTMSRMDRLFGVTMAERGVSQLVSVDLRRAEQLLAAE